MLKNGAGTGIVAVHPRVDRLTRWGELPVLTASFAAAAGTMTRQKFLVPIGTATRLLPPARALAFVWSRAPNCSQITGFKFATV